MNFKTLSGLIGLVLFVAFLLPPLFKLKDIALGSVLLIGIVLAGYEFYEGLHGRDKERS